MNKIEILTDGELKNKWIEVINSDVPTNERVRESLSTNGKAYLVVAGESYIDKIYKTKSARNYVKKQQGKSYYDEYTMEMKNVGAGLKIVEIKEDEIMETDEPKLFYRWIFNEYRSAARCGLNVTRIKSFYYKYDMDSNEDIKKLVSDSHIEQMKRGIFSNIEKFEDKVEVEEEVKIKEKVKSDEEVKENNYYKKYLKTLDNSLEVLESDFKDVYIKCKELNTNLSSLFIRGYDRLKKDIEDAKNIKLSSIDLMMGIESELYISIKNLRLLRNKLKEENMIREAEQASREENKQEHINSIKKIINSLKQPDFIELDGEELEVEGYNIEVIIPDKNNNRQKHFGRLENTTAIAVLMDKDGILSSCDLLENVVDKFDNKYFLEQISYSYLGIYLQ